MKRLARLSIFVAIVLSRVAGCDSGPSRQDFLVWDINSSLGLAGGLNSERFAAEKLGVRSPEEIDILQHAERMACPTYLKRMALFVEGARGGEAEKYAAAGYELSVAQARLGWATGDANETVARLEQAEKFADLWLEAITAAYDAETVSLEQFVEAADAHWRIKIARPRVLNALKRLGVETKNLPRQIDPKNPRDDDCPFHMG
jgi:hypothetical protein